MNTVVVAGAGAGKTYALVQNYISSLFGFNEEKKRIHPSRILAVTFTEKAAAEMRTRVITKLLQIARDGKFDDWMLERAAFFAMPLPSVLELRLMSRWLLSAPISTFHSFCSQIIKDHSEACNVDSEFSLLEPLIEKEIALDIAESVVVDALTKRLAGVDALIARFQLRKIGEAKGLCDSLVILHSYLTEHGIVNEEILASHRDIENYESAHSKKMAEHISEIQTAIANFRSTKLTPKVAERLDDIEISFQRFKALTETGDDLEARLSFGYQEFRKMIKGRFGNDELRKALVGTVVALGSYLCIHFTSKEAKTICALLERFAAKFKAHKEEFAELSFSDLLSKAREVLRNNLSVRQSVKNQYVRVLVDEFQDTSPVQEDLVALICEEKSSLAKIEATQRAMAAVRLEKDMLFVVGDPKQSIYGFRGADVSLFQHTLKIVTEGTAHQEPTGEKKSLKLCRRSQGTVVELVNIIGEATLHLPAEGITFGKDDCLSALKPAQEKAGAIWLADFSSKEPKDKASSEALAKKLQELAAKKNAQWKDIVILVRRIKTATPIMTALQKLNIPVFIFGGEGFYSRSEVMDILAALKLAVDANDEIATLTVLRSCLIAMSDADLVLMLDGIENWEKGVSFQQIINAIESIPVGEEVKQRLVKFNEVLLSIREGMGRYSLASFIDLILDKCQYLLSIAVEDDAEDRFANLLKLRSMCVKYVDDSYMRINQMWDRLDNPPKESLGDSLSSEVNAVRIMTIHQSKGLEFDYVVLADTLSTDPNDTDDIVYHSEVGLAVTHKGRPISACAPQTSDEKKQFPTNIDLVRQKRKQASQSELARLLYVALTRAKEQVFFMDILIDGKKTVDRGANLRQLFYAGKKNKPVRFEEIMPTQVAASGLDLANNKLQKKDSPYFVPQFSKQKQLKKRLLASSIQPFKKIESEPGLEPEPRKNRQQAGTVGHRILALVGSLIGKETTEADLDLMLKAASAQMGFECGVDDLDVIIEDCKITLLGVIENLLRKNYFLQFEKPIFLEKENEVIEGFADLVAFAEDECLIVDFKSSAASTKSKTTLRQLEAYAAALGPTLDMPIGISAWVIGQPNLLLL